MPRVIVLDELSSEGLALLESAGNVEVEVRTGLKGTLDRAGLVVTGAVAGDAGAPPTGTLPSSDVAAFPSGEAFTELDLTYGVEFEPVRTRPKPSA